MKKFTKSEISKLQRTITDSLDSFRFSKKSPYYLSFIYLDEKTGVTSIIDFNRYKSTYGIEYRKFDINGHYIDGTYDTYSSSVFEVVDYMFHRYLMSLLS